MIVDRSLLLFVLAAVAEIGGALLIDLIGAGLCLVGVAVIMYAPRGG